MPLRNFPTPGVRDGRTNQEQTAGDSDRSDGWAGFTGIFRSSSGPLPQPWGELFGPLRAGAVDDLVVVGQIGQSIDGRIATTSGHSKYINGPAGLAHLHRLRALVDAVVIGVGTALADDPQLTVRRVAGPQPVRIVIDPNGRSASARFRRRRRPPPADNGAGARCAAPTGWTFWLCTADGRIAPPAILAALARCGFRRLLIEGGADAVSRFLVAGCLDAARDGRSDHPRRERRFDLAAIDG